MTLLRSLITGPPTLNRYPLSREFYRGIGWFKPDSDGVDAPHTGRQRAPGEENAHGVRSGHQRVDPWARQSTSSASIWQSTASRYMERGQSGRIPAERRLGAAEFREINRIGVNLNQMARVLNSGAVPVPGPAPAEILVAVERVGELVAALLAGEAD